MSSILSQLEDVKVILIHFVDLFNSFIRQLEHLGYKHSRQASSKGRAYLVTFCHIVFVGTIIKFLRFVLVSVHCELSVPLLKIPALHLLLFARSFIPSMIIVVLFEVYLCVQILARNLFDTILKLSDSSIIFRQPLAYAIQVLYNFLLYCFQLKSIRNCQPRKLTASIALLFYLANLTYEHKYPD